MTTTAYDRAIRAIEADILACASSLIHTLAQGFGDDTSGTPLADLVDQAFELSAPVLDYESAAYDAGWTDLGDYDDWQELCDLEGIKPYEREVFEHWIVSHWLGERLAEKGERVDFDFAGMVIWARTTTGQAICIDHVIQQIAKDLADA